jgi:hypothetical protein
MRNRFAISQAAGLSVERAQVAFALADEAL